MIILQWRTILTYYPSLQIAEIYITKMGYHYSCLVLEKNDMTHALPRRRSCCQRRLINSPFHYTHRGRRKGCICNALRRISSARYSIRIAILCSLLLLPICQSSLPLTTVTTATATNNNYRQTKRRRRNNTGFYYGLRDDDICRVGEQLSPREPISALNDSVCLAAPLAKVHEEHHCLSRANNISSNTALPNRALEDMGDRLSNHLSSISAAETLRQKLSAAPAIDELRNRLSSYISTSSQTLIQRIDPERRRSDVISMLMQQGNSIVTRGGSIIVKNTAATKTKKGKRRRKNNTGFYYGIREDVLLDRGDTIKKKKGGGESSKKKKPQQQQPKIQTKKKQKKTILDKESLSKANSKKKINEDTPSLLSETLLELREMREEIIALRSELQGLKGKEQLMLKEETCGDTAVKGDEEIPQAQKIPKKDKRSRHSKLERISKDVEDWAMQLLFNNEDLEDEFIEANDGWKEISCNKFVSKKFNNGGRTKVYLKWMPDCRDEQDIESEIAPDPNQDYPCIRCYSTIDAPLDKVCDFLANPDTIPLYNDLVADHSDVEEITPSSKITWCKIPKVLFVKPRDFVTYCSHRWRKDGTQVIVNQACEHNDMPGVATEGKSGACRGFALRGANCELCIYVLLFSPTSVS